MFLWKERKKDPPALLRNAFPDFIITTLHCPQVYQFNVPTFGPGVVFDVDYSIRMEQFRFFTEALTVKRLKSYVDFMVEEAEVCCCTAKSSFKVFATADEAKHPQKKEEKQNLICFLFCREPAFSLRQNSFLFNLLVKLLDNVRSLLKL